MRNWAVPIFALIIYGQTGDDHCFEDALEYVIKDLEQEPILDKIRAEIEDMDAPDYGFAGFEAFYMCQSEVLQIIDKYKAKTEET